MSDSTDTTNDQRHPLPEEPLRAAREKLHDALSREPDGDEEGWLRQTQAAVHLLGDALAEHQRMAEAEDGPIPEATALKPSLLGAASRLEREHTEMRLRAKEIEQEIERQIAFEEFKVELIRLETAVLHEMFHLHLVRADWMVYDAYYQVEGGESG